MRVNFGGLAGIVWLVEDPLEEELRPALRMVAPSLHLADAFVRRERESRAVGSHAACLRDQWPLEIREVEIGTDLIPPPGVVISG